MAGRVLSFEPLLARVGGSNDWERAQSLGVPRSRVLRWRRRGLSPDEADVLACRLLNVHPSEVWANWFDVSLADMAEP